MLDAYPSFVRASPALAKMDSDVTTKLTKDTKGENARGDADGMRIGMVGPMSNYASRPQLVENVPYTNLEEVHVFARRWRYRHRGQWFTAGKLSGFCLLMKRAVYEAVGGLDERSGSLGHAPSSGINRGTGMSPSGSR